MALPGQPKVSTYTFSPHVFANTVGCMRSVQNVLIGLMLDYTQMVLTRSRKFVLYVVFIGNGMGN